MKFVDLEFENQQAVEASHKNFLEIEQSGKYLLGSKLEEFENLFSKDQKLRGTVAVKNATDALYLTFKILKSEQRCIVVPQFGAYPTVMAAFQSNAKQIIAAPVDNNLTIDLNEIKIPNNSIIVAVNLFGNSCNMNALYQVASKTNSLVIEDCAQSTGLKKNNKTYAYIHSFYPTKPLGCRGDGGAILSDDFEFLLKCKQSRFYGLDDAGVISSWGFNSRMDEWQAALLSSKINYYRKMNESRRNNAMKYTEALEGNEVYYKRNSVFHQYVTLWKSRDEIKNKLNSLGIPAMIHYPKMLSDMTFLSDKITFSSCKKVSKHILSIPVGPHLSKFEIEKIQSSLSKLKNEKIKFSEIEQ